MTGLASASRSKAESPALRAGTSRLIHQLAEWLQSRRVKSLALTFIFGLLLLTSCTLFHVTRPVIKIGLAAPFEGRYRYIGYDAIYAARLLVRQVNAAGGVNGHTLELVAYNDGGTVQGAITAARNLSLDPDVLAVIGHYRPETTRAALDVYQQAGLPLIAIGAPPPQALAEALCAALPAGRWALVSDEANHDLAQALRLAAQRHSIKLVADAAPAEIARLDASQFTGVFLLLDPVSAGETLVALQAMGWQGSIAGGPDLASPLFATLAEEAAWGSLYVTPYRQPDDAAFIAAYREMGPHTPPPGPFALASYKQLGQLLTSIEDDGDVWESLSAAPQPAFIYRLGPHGPQRVFEN